MKSNVGIGDTNPNATLFVVVGGTTLADAWSVRSSRDLKENIKLINPTDIKILPNLYTYNYINDSNKAPRLGIMAEEVPELCRTPQGGVIDSCLASIAYTKVALLEQENQALKKQAQDIIARLENLEAQK